MNTTPKKTGRPLAEHRCADGTKVQGLKKLKDGRWRISASLTGARCITFTEPDERLAVARFLQWQEAKEDRSAVPVTIRQRSHTSIVHMPARDIWTWLREQLLERPAYIAKMTGIEQVAYLSELKKPEPLPSFREMARLWADKYNASAELKRRCPQSWRDFVKITGVESLDQITPQVCVDYRDAVRLRGLTGKGQLNLFTRIRRYIAWFAKERALAVEEMHRVLNAMATLQPDSSTVNLNPKPIDRTDWHKLLEAAEVNDRAMLLLCLNCAMYLQEVVRLHWDDIRSDGTMVTRRAKTGGCIRAAVLWPETRDALHKLKRRGPAVFTGMHGKALGVKGAELRFRALRTRAGCEHVTSSQFRDGALSAAAVAGVPQQFLQVLAGHRAPGVTDNYVARVPQMVAPACEAIRRAYMADPGEIQGG